MTLGDGFILALAAILLAVILAMQSLPRKVRVLLAAGLVLRIIGGQLYYAVGEMVYGGTADYWIYFRHGALYAEALLAGTPESSGSFWLARNEWCCTPFTIRVTGTVLMAIEPSIFGAFVLFGVVGYVGVIAFAAAAWRAFPEIRTDRYLFWLAFFPSLWYWPAAPGKDALIMAGLGIAVLGYVGRANRVNWLALAAGTALVFAVRPQVAIVLLFAVGVGHWLSVLSGATLTNAIQGVLIAALGVGVVLAAQHTMGLTFTDAGDVGDYLAGQQEVVASMEGSGVTSAFGGVLAPVAGFFNVLTRPLVWEARSSTSLIAAVEILGVWLIGFWRRREIASFIRTYRGRRMFWMAVAFIVVYAAALGMGAGNMGVIARQRIHLLPFVFMFFAGLRAPRPAAHAGVGSAASRWLPRPLPSA